MTIDRCKDTPVGIDKLPFKTLDGDVFPSYHTFTSLRNDTRSIESIVDIDEDTFEVHYRRTL